MLDEWERSRGFKEAVGASYPGAPALMLQSCNSEQVLDRERRLEVFANTGPSGLFRARPLPAQNGGEDRAVRNYPGFAGATVWRLHPSSGWGEAR